MENNSQGNEFALTSQQQRLIELITKELGQPNEGYTFADFAGAQVWSIGANKDNYKGLFLGIDSFDEITDDDGNTLFCLFRPEGGEEGTETEHDIFDTEFFRILVEDAIECITERKYFLTDRSGKDGSSQITFLQCLSMYESNCVTNDRDDAPIKLSDSFYGWLVSAEVGNEYEYDNATSFKRTA